MEIYILHPDKSQEEALRTFLKALNVPFLTKDLYSLQFEQVDDEEQEIE